MEELYTNNDVNKDIKDTPNVDYGKGLSNAAISILVIEGIACLIFALASAEYTEGLSILISFIAFFICLATYYLFRAIAQIATNSKRIAEALIDNQDEIIHYTKQQRNILLDIRKELQNKE